MGIGMRFRGSSIAQDQDREKTVLRHSFLVVGRMWPSWARLEPSQSTGDHLFVDALHDLVGDFPHL